MESVAVEVDPSEVNLNTEIHNLSQSPRLDSILPTISFGEAGVRSRSNSVRDTKKEWHISSTYSPLSNVVDEVIDDRNWKIDSIEIKNEIPGPFNWKLVVAWIALITAVIVGAAIGPAFKMLDKYHIEPMLAASWRSQCMLFALAPFALIEWFQSKFRRPIVCSSSESRISLHRSTGSSQNNARHDTIDSQNKPWFTLSPPHGTGLAFPLWVYVLLGGLSWSSNLIFWSESLRWTSTVKASITVGTHPIILVLFFAANRMPVHALEWTGVLLAFCGLSLAVLDTDAEAEAFGMKKELLGLGMCLLSAVGQTFAIINWSKISDHVPVMRYTVCTTFIVGLVSSIASISFMGSEFSFDLSNGIFGWISTRWLVKIIIFSFGMGVAYIAGTNFAMKHISPLVFSSCLLVDPAATGLISWLLKIEDLPGWFTVGGGVIVISGIALIIVGEHKRKSVQTTKVAQGSSGSTVDSGTGVTLRVSWSDTKPHLLPQDSSHETICDDQSGFELSGTMRSMKVIAGDGSNNYPNNYPTDLPEVYPIPILHPLGEGLYDRVSALFSSSDPNLPLSTTEQRTDGNSSSCPIHEVCIASTQDAHDAVGAA